MDTVRPIFDAHLDLAWSALYFDRDLTLDVGSVRQREEGMTDAPGRACNTVTFPELQKAGVQWAVATLLARSGPEQPARPIQKRMDLDYVSQINAFAIAQGQLAYYRMLEDQGLLRIIRSVEGLKASGPLGIMLSMEGADPIVSPAQVQQWWDAGLRAVGPAHYGRSHYAYGTGVSGPLSPLGIELLQEFERVGMILDVTHLCDESMAEALDRFSGPVLASHHNCRALVPGDRQLTDEQIGRLIQRDAVIGVALDAWMLYPNWVRGQTRPEVVGLSAAADQIDHVCQLAGDARHSGIGSDLDGGFGTEQTPRDLNTIADLQHLGAILSDRGYADADIDLIFHGNWLRFFSQSLPNEKNDEAP